MNVYYVVANGTLVAPVSFCEKQSIFCFHDDTAKNIRDNILHTYS